MSNTMRKTGTGCTGLVMLATIAVILIATAAWAADPVQKNFTTAAWWKAIWCMKRWSPYLVGMGIGILSWFTFLVSDKAIGVSTAYARTGGMIEESIKGPQAKEKAYYQEYAPKIDWEWMLVAGLVAGAFISASLSGDFKLEFVPPLWESYFGHTPVLRLVATFIGGIILGIGARWADGCTSGHGISGTLQLVVSSWVAVISFFIGGVITAFLMFYAF